MPLNSMSPLREAQECARKRGDNTFSVSMPCANGHFAARYASNGVCVKCAAEYRKNAKPREQRLLKISSAQCRVRQISQDDLSSKLAKHATHRFAEITGRPASLSVIHKAGLILLANYLKPGRTAADVLGLIR